MTLAIPTCSAGLSGPALGGPTRSVAVGIADMKVSADPAQTLVTYALGSCLGLAIHDPVAQVAGLLHCMLPLGRLDPGRAMANPYMFVDTGVPALFEAAYRLGARKERITVKAAGCAQILDDGGFFRIGERNYGTLRRVLGKNKVQIHGEDVGGELSRTMYLKVGSGQVSLRVKGQVVEL